MTIADELLALDRKFWTDGADFYREHADRSCLVVFTAMPAVLKKERLAATVENAPRWRDLQIDVKGIISPQPGLAILSYEASAERAGGQHYRALVSSGYAKRAEGWKLAFHQQTPIDPV